MQIPVASWSELKHAALLPENAPTPLESSAQNKKGAHMASKRRARTRVAENGIRYVKI